MMLKGALGAGGLSLMARFSKESIGGTRPESVPNETVPAGALVLKPNEPKVQRVRVPGKIQNQRIRGRRKKISWY
jgi:hypothetical protein